MVRLVDKIYYLLLISISSSTNTHAQPYFFGQILSTVKHNSIVILKEGSNVKVIRIGDQVNGLWVSDIIYRYVYFVDDFGFETIHMIGSPIVKKELKPKDYFKKDFIKVGNVVYVSKKFKSGIVERLPEILLKAASEPYYEYDPFIQEYNMVGFRLFDIDPYSIFSDAGIENGDIITHINNLPLTGINSTIALMRKIEEKREITFEYIRNGVVNHTIIKIEY